MEDALISPMGFMILSGAGLLEASEENKIKVHKTKVTNEINHKDGNITIDLDEKPYFVTKDGKSSDDIELELGEIYKLDDSGKNNFIYIMDLDNGEVCSEPYIPMSITENVKKVRDLDKNTISVFVNSDPENNLKKGYSTETSKKENYTDGSITFSYGESPDPTTFYIPLVQTEKIIKMRINFVTKGDNSVYINLQDGIYSGTELKAINGDNGNIFEIYGNISDISAYSTLGSQITIDLYEEYEPDSYQLTLNPDDDMNVFEDNKTVLVDYYVSKNKGVQ
jgi:hypothetical protein